MQRLIFGCLCFSLFASTILVGQITTPMLRACDKNEAKRGDVVTVSGQNLAKPSVASLYLSKGNDDIEVQIQEQTDTSIRFVVANTTPYGRYGLLILTGGDSPMYIDQPVKLNVVEQYTPEPEAPPSAELPGEGAEPPA